jgi:type II secretory pathway component PulF
MTTITNTYRYRAATRDGSITHGTVYAGSRDDARTRLTARGLYAIGIHELSPRERRRRMPAADLALGFRILADLLDARLSIAQVLQAFAGVAPEAWRDALPGIEQSIREGEELSSALAASSLDIPPLVIGMLRAGETGAGIGSAMRGAADWSEKAAETRAAIRSALAYPTFVAVAGIGAIVALVTVVLPRFARILSDLGEALPPSTRILLSIAHAARLSLLPLVGLSVLASVAYRLWLRDDVNARRVDRLLLRVPRLGELRIAAATARVAHSLGMMLATRVALAVALPLAARAAGDREIESRVVDARELVIAGMTLSRSIEIKNALSPTAIRLIRAGEESGHVADMLMHATRIEQRRVERTIRTATRLLEPALLLVFALIVGFVAAGLLQAIYSVRPTP